MIAKRLAFLMILLLWIIWFMLFASGDRGQNPAAPEGGRQYRAATVKSIEARGRRPLRLQFTFEEYEDAISQ